jgi:hypothetical protein
VTIQQSIGPAEGLAIIEKELQSRASRVAQIPSLNGSPSLLDPVAVFHLDFKSVEYGPGLKQARRVAWWYVIVGGVKPAIATLQDSGQGLRFAGIAHGPLAERFLEACVLADRELGSAAATYEPRIFDMPALDLIALWLFGNDQRFISLMDGTPRGTAPLSITSDIEGRIKDELFRRSQGKDERRIEGSPSN